MSEQEKEKRVGLTPEERTVLLKLGEVANAYFALPVDHPSEQGEFCDAIHRAQDLIAVRVARRADPDVWRQPDGFNGSPLSPVFVDGDIRDFDTWTLGKQP